MFACPEDLDPRTVCVQAKPLARERGLVFKGSPDSVIPHPMAEFRRVPMRRLIARLGLSEFNNIGPLVDHRFTPKQVNILLKQHAGAPAVPQVKTGDRVREGDLLARARAGKTWRTGPCQHRRPGDSTAGFDRHRCLREGVNVTTEINSVGLIELSSVATGFLVEDLMLKAGSVQLLLARTICSGKFLIVVSGDVTSVQAALHAGAAAAGPSLIERRQIARVHPSVLAAISQSVDIDPKQLRSIGVIETFSAASVIEAADTAVKSANVTLLRVHLAMALGGKGFVVMAGDVSSVQAAVAAASKTAADDGMLVGRGVIPAPSPELFRDYI